MFGGRISSWTEQVLKWIGMIKKNYLKLLGMGVLLYFGRIIGWWARYFVRSIVGYLICICNKMNV